MNKADLNEAVRIVQAAIDGLLNTLQGSTGLPGASLRLVCGRLSANAATEIAGGSLGADLALCFESARLAGGTFENIDVVRAAMEAEAPIGGPALAVRNACVRLALIQQAKIISATTFVSREDIDRYIERVNAAFDTAETVAANDLDTSAYRALIALHAAVANDLSTRAIPLPRVVVFTMPKVMPALVIAQRLYYDAGRALELISENKPVHPAFCPARGRALAS